MKYSGYPNKGMLATVAFVLAAAFALAGCSGQPLSTREEGTLGGGVLGAGTGAVLQFALIRLCIRDELLQIVRAEIYARHQQKGLLGRLCDRHDPVLRQLWIAKRLQFVDRKCLVVVDVELVQDVRGRFEFVARQGFESRRPRLHSKERR